MYDHPRTCLVLLFSSYYFMVEETYYDTFLRLSKGKNFVLNTNKYKVSVCYKNAMLYILCYCPLQYLI